MSKPGLQTDVKAFMAERNDVDWTSRDSTSVLYERFNCVTQKEKSTIRGYKSNALKAMRLKISSPPKEPVSETKQEKSGQVAFMPETISKKNKGGRPKMGSGETVKIGFVLDKDLWKRFKKTLIDRDKKASDIMREWIQAYTEGSR
jgi:hypothetical protein